MYKHPSVYLLATRIDRFLYIPFAFTAILFLVTFFHHTYPGHSATLVAEAARMTPSIPPTHSLFYTFSQAIASYNFLPLPTRLNLFAVLCGCISAMLFYRLVARTILFYAYDPHEDESQAEWSEDEVDSLPSFESIYKSIGEFNQRLLSIAIKSSLAATLLLAMMAPFWLASLHLNESIFNLALMLIVLTLVPDRESPLEQLRFLGVMFLYTLGLFESILFLLLLPFIAKKAFNFYLRTNNRGLVILHTLFGSFGGVLISFALRPLPPDALYVPLLTSLEQFLRAAASHHLAEVKMLLRIHGWLASFLQVAIPTAILFFGKTRMLEKWGSHTSLASLLLLCVAIPTLLCLPLSPFRVFQQVDYLPLVSATLFAATLAFVLAASLLFFVPKISSANFNKEVFAEGDETPPPPSKKPATFFLIVLLLAAVVTPVCSLPYIKASKSRFADEIARSIINSLGERSWLITHGHLDDHLQIQAHDLKKTLHVVTLRQIENAKERLALQHLVETESTFQDLNRPRLLNALSIGTLRFVSEWFSSDSNCVRKVAVFATPDLWTACQIRAIPHGLIFTGSHPGESLDTQPLITNSITLATRLAPLLLSKDEKSSPAPARLSARLRLKMGFSVNELGTILEGNNQATEAFEAYQRASQIDPDNISALLNAYAMAKGGIVKGKQAEILRQRLRHLLQNRAKTQLGLQGLFLNYGTIHQKAFYQTEAATWLSRGVQAIAAGKLAKSLDLSQQTGVKTLVEHAYYYSIAGKLEEAEACYLAALEQDAADFDALYGMTILQINRGDIPKAEEWLARATATKHEKNVTLLYPTILIAIQKGDKEKAERLLVEATKKYPKEERFWKLRANFMIKQGDFLLVRHRLLPEMEKALQDPDHYLIHIARGLLLKQQGSSYYRDARISLLKGLSRNASMAEIWNMVLELDMHIGNLELMESDLHHLLTLDPNHAQANYMKGSIQLARGNITSAEDFMRRSIERTPNALACNDLAEILRRKRKLEEAKALAHQAISLDPQLPNARATLAAILADMEKAKSEFHSSDEQK
jgi:tetratricopeptide (TPR) repeat protein